MLLRKQQKSILDCFITLLLVFGATVIGLLFRSWELSETNIIIMYILFVLLTARFTNGYINPTTCDGALIVEMFDMLLGRLEIFIVLIGITFGFKMLIHPKRK